MKKPHSAVNYRKAQHANTCCAVCTMYRTARELRSDGTRRMVPHCVAVEDPIRPGDICNIFQRRIWPRS